MCGIAGALGPHDLELIDAMADALHHRGPDDRGIHRAPGVSLANTRLSIVDVAGGRQPIYSEDGHLCIVCNGEIYNASDLRQRLSGRHHLRTRSDTEVILHLYEEYGPACVELLRGMFALAIWDGERLFLARDRLGIKPLFYYCDPGSRWLLFGSEVRALLQDARVPAQWDEQSLYELWAIGYPLQERCYFRQIYQLAPGTSLTVTPAADGRLHMTHRRYFAPTFHPVAGAPDANSLLELLRQAVASQLMGEVPIGLLLSGGVDSRILALLLRELLPEEPIHAFTVADHPDHPDLLGAAELAAQLGLIHHRLIVTPADFLADLPDAILAAESPNISFPMYVAARAARPYVKVLLCGEGADELFGGYWMMVDPQRWQNGLLSNLRTFAPQDLAGDLLADVERHRSAGLPAGEQIRRWHVGAQLANNHLWYCDRLSMAHGVEVRVPFLDEAVVEAALHADFSTLVDPPVTKVPLRRVLAALLAARGIEGAPTRYHQPRKLALPSAFATLYGYMERWAGEAVSDRALAEHPLRQMLRSKGELAALQLWERLMLRGRGRVAPIE